MNRQTLTVVASVVALVGVIVLAALGWWLAAPLFVSETVDEDFPAIPMPDATELAGMSDDALAAAEDAVLEAYAAMPDTGMDEPMPETAVEPARLLSGSFVDADVFHQGSGQVIVYQLEDGSRVLRLEDFEVTNGPDLHVLLATGEQPTNRDDLGDYVDLGPLRGNVGNQNYDIPAGTNLAQYNSIVIYCVPFHVVFSTATLN